MTDHDDVAQRAYHQPDPDRVVVRDLDESEDGMFAIRMPISSTLEARDGDAFDGERLRGWATQINEGTVGVFLDHGMNTDLSMSRYSGTGKLGYYADAEVEQRDDGEFELVADTRIMDPDTLPESTGTLREHLSRIKAQAERGIPIAQSVGWADDTGGRDIPGDSDLLEGSIVGVPSDPEASSHSTGEALARAAVAGRPDADPERLVEDFRAVVMGADERDEHDMTDEETDSPGDEPGDDRDGSDGTDDAEQFREFMREQTETQTEILRTLSDALRADDDDDDGDDDEDEEEDDEDDDRDADGGDGDRTIEIDGEEVSAEDAIRQLHSDLDDAEPETPGDGDEDGDRDEEPTDERTNDPRNLL